MVTVRREASQTDLDDKDGQKFRYSPLLQRTRSVSMTVPILPFRSTR
jgi:hypothetical protein